MERDRGLRAGASLLAAVVFAGSYEFVLAHPKNPDAPLQPPAADDVAIIIHAPTPSATPKTTATPRGTPVRGTPPPKITLQPGVRATELPGITYTHVS
jgi:hypothetical protein